MFLKRLLTQINILLLEVSMVEENPIGLILSLSALWVGAALL